MNQFEEGYKYISVLMGAETGAYMGDNYIAAINKAISNFENNLKQYAGNQLSDERLAGFIAEHWHSGTFNVNAAVNGVSSKTTVEGVNTFGSVDVSSNFGKNYGSKYLNSASNTGHAQSISYWERYCQYKAQAEKSSREIMSFHDFLRSRGMDPNTNPNYSIYYGQYRLVPKDQIDQVRAYLEKKIAQTSATRPELAEKYKETLQMLTDRISDSKGTESIPLSTDEAIELARRVRTGGEDLSKYGISLKELVQPRHIMQQALKAGVSSAVITMVLQTAPEIYKLLSYMAHYGEFDIEQIKKTGKVALTSSAEGFLRGGIAAALTISLQAENFGTALADVNPSVIGAAVALSIETLKNAVSLANGTIKKGEFFDNLFRNVFSTGFAVVGGGALGAVIPVYGYLLGSFLGGIIGNFTYKACNKLYMALCVENGWTLFGIVDQNYELPDETLKEIGIDVFEYDKFQYDKFSYDTFGYDTFSYDTFVPDTIDITFLRRGVVGVHEIAYC